MIKTGVREIVCRLFHLPSRRGAAEGAHILSLGRFIHFGVTGGLQQAIKNLAVARFGIGATPCESGAAFLADRMVAACLGFGFADVRTGLGLAVVLAARGCCCRGLESLFLVGLHCTCRCLKHYNWRSFSAAWREMQFAKNCIFWPPKIR